MTQLLSFQCQVIRQRRYRAMVVSLLLLTLTMVLGATACRGETPQSESTLSDGVPEPVDEQTGVLEDDVAATPPDQDESNAATIPTPTLAAPALPTPAPTVETAPEQVQVAVDRPPTPEITPLAEPAPTAVSALLVAPLPTPPGVYSWTLDVPILMYHYISTPPEDADIYRVDLSVTADAFAEQMAYLRDNGYTTIDLYDLSLAITNQSELPDKPIIVTFDDGYIDAYENAFPVLVSNGQKGTFFAITEFIDLEREGYLTWAMVKEMADAGMRFESHSRTHPDLTTLTADGLIWEMLGSQQTLAAHLGYTPRYFSYPGGDYNEDTIAMLRDLDFWGALTTSRGSWHGFDDRFEWTRIRVRNDTTMAEFALATDLEGTVGGKSP